MQSRKRIIAFLLLSVIIVFFLVGHLLIGKGSWFTEWGFKKADSALWLLPFNFTFATES